MDVMAHLGIRMHLGHRRRLRLVLKHVGLVSLRREKRRRLYTRASPQRRLHTRASPQRRLHTRASGDAVSFSKFGCALVSINFRFKARVRVRAKIAHTALKRGRQ